MTYGTRGDVEPFIALGAALIKHGIHVRIATPHTFASFARQHGLDVLSLPGDPVQLARSLVVQAGVSRIGAIRSITRFVLPLARKIYETLRQECAGSNVIVHSFLMTLAGYEIARDLGVPDFSAQFFPIFAPTDQFPALTFPEKNFIKPLNKYYNLLTHRLNNAIYWLGSRFVYNLVRRESPHLPPLDGWPFRASIERPATPLLFAISPSVLDQNTGWQEGVHVTGYWFLEPHTDWHPPDELDGFISNGTPPIYIGFGSTSAAKAQWQAQVAIKALEISGQRGILFMPSDNIDGIKLPPSIFRIDSVPHPWLFPRMTAVVHHGGAGTTAQGLRAGIPNIIVPFTTDQPYWARRVEKLGAGPEPIPARYLTAEKLASAIHLAVNKPEYRHASGQLSNKISTERGVLQAVNLILRSL